MSTDFLMAATLLTVVLLFLGYRYLVKPALARRAERERAAIESPSPPDNDTPNE
jgi:flagellar biosynthesis/type III secretory pathway M-ring protein FliF/YscJ